MQGFSRSSCVNASLVKGSSVKKYAASLREQYPALAEVIDEILPSKAEVTLVKCKDSVQLLVVTVDPNTTYNDTSKRFKRVFFWSLRDGVWLPTLRLLHLHPGFLPLAITDKGCPKNIFNGAQMMAPGIHAIDETLEVGTYVAVSIPEAPAFFIGRLAQSGADILAEGRHGAAIEVIHILDDGLWQMKDKYE